MRAAVQPLRFQRLNKGNNNGRALVPCLQAHSGPLWNDGTGKMGDRTLAGEETGRKRLWFWLLAALLALLFLLAVLKWTAPPTAQSTVHASPPIAGGSSS